MLKSPAPRSFVEKILIFTNKFYQLFKNDLIRESRAGFGFNQTVFGN